MCPARSRRKRRRITQGVNSGEGCFYGVVPVACLELAPLSAGRFPCSVQTLAEAQLILLKIRFTDSGKTDGTDYVARFLLPNPLFAGTEPVADAVQSDQFTLVALRQMGGSHDETLSHFRERVKYPLFAGSQPRADAGIANKCSTTFW